MKCKDCPRFEFSLRSGAMVSEGFVRKSHGYCRLKDEHVNGKNLTSCSDHPDAESMSEDEMKRFKSAESHLRYYKVRVAPHGLTTQGLRYRQTHARSGKGGYAQLQSEQLKISLLKETRK